MARATVTAMAAPAVAKVIAGATAEAMAAAAVTKATVTATASPAVAKAIGGGNSRGKAGGCSGQGDSRGTTVVMVEA